MLKAIYKMVATTLKQTPLKAWRNLSHQYTKAELKALTEGHVCMRKYQSLRNS